MPAPEVGRAGEKSSRRVLPQASAIGCMPGDRRRARWLPRLPARLPWIRHAQIDSSRPRHLAVDQVFEARLAACCQTSRAEVTSPLPTASTDQTHAEPADTTAGERNNGPGHTHSAVKGKKAARLPHERDESPDSGAQPASEQMRLAHDDAASDKAETDRGEVTDTLYQRTLRDAPPGAERDEPG
jgi:hypothetical protein